MRFVFVLLGNFKYDFYSPCRKTQQKTNEVRQLDFLHRTWAEIDINALIHNFNIIKSGADGCRIMAVVKADAYGHSALNVAPVLQENGADAFAVSNIEEAITLRGCGITKPILILGYTPVSMAPQLYINDITQCVYSSEYAKGLSEYAQKSGVISAKCISCETFVFSCPKAFIAIDANSALVTGISGL